MTPPKMIALMDMDGTLCDYEGQMTKECSEIIGSPVNIHDPQWKKLVSLIKERTGFWSSLPPLEFGFKVMELLRANDFKVHILTRGPYRALNGWSEKMRWCRQYFPKVPVTMTEDKGLVYGKVLVDDWPPYIERWLKWWPRGLVIMPAHPYNESFTHPQVLRSDLGSLDRVDEALKDLRLI